MLLTLTSAMLMAVQASLPPRRPPQRPRPQYYFTPQELAQQGFRRVTGAALKRLLVGRLIVMGGGPLVVIQHYQTDGYVTIQRDIWDPRVPYTIKGDRYCWGRPKYPSSCYALFMRNNTVHLSTIEMAGTHRPLPVIMKGL